MVQPPAGSPRRERYKRPPPSTAKWILGALLCGGLLVVGVMVATAYFIGVPRVQERRDRLTCAQNLSVLGRMWVERQMQRKGDEKLGPGLLLAWREADLVPTVIREIKDPYLCPRDPRGLDRGARCSYAVRDFAAHPLSVDAPDIIASDRCGDDGRTPHHADGVMVLFSNGSTRFLDWQTLGIDPDTDVIVGPDSKSELLRKLRVP